VSVTTTSLTIAVRRAEMLERHRSDVLARIDELNDALSLINRKIAMYRKEIA
jgi:hypothetical protein